LNAFKKRFGSEVFHVVEQANGEAFRKQGIEFSMEHTANGIQMKCTICSAAELYNQAGGTEWGRYHLYCAADKHIVEVFNP
jgi:hypothetical protein